MALADVVLGQARHLQLDENGRIGLGPDLREFAGLTDQALFVGHGRSFQIWDPEAYAARQADRRDMARANFHLLPWGKKAAAQ